MQISVVIPTMGRLATLRRTLGRLDRQTTPPGEFEVIVVADAAVTETEALDSLVRGRPYRARRLQATLRGAAAARNAGWRAAEAALLLFTDDDILADPRMLEEHLRWHRRHPAEEVGVLGHVRWADELRVTPFMRWLDHGIQFNYPSITGEETVWANMYTANVSLKRTLVASVDGFDEQRLPYLYEDLDLALRMHRRAGFRLLYNAAAAAEHLQPMDLDYWSQRVPQVAVAERQFVKLHPEVPPYFQRLFVDASSRPPASGRVERVAAVVPRGLPVVGPFVWSRLDLYYRQCLATPFLQAWAAAEQDADGHRSLERRPAGSSGGSPPGGPK